ncbi:DUF2092 domain-containing protein [bacterium]|nr:DUF2092 domain-containing protein [bacterium]
MATSTPIPAKAIEIIDKMETKLSGKNLLVVLKNEEGKKRFTRLKGPLPNEEKLIIDVSGKIKQESRLYIEGKISPLIQGGKVFRDEKGRLISYSALQPTINLYDGKYHWIYTPYDNKFIKREKGRDFAKVMRRFFLSGFVPLKENLIEALPIIEKIEVKKTKYEGKESFLMTFYIQKKNKARYWIDAKKYLPLQSEFETKEKSGTYIIRRKVLKIKINPNLPPDVFVFTPPRGAKPEIL